MKFEKINPPRNFYVGSNNRIKISHTMDIYLKDNEQITFKKKIGNKISEFDICKKDWGYYALPSINSRLKHFDFSTYIISNLENRIYIFIVHNSKKDKFYKYLKDEKQKILFNFNSKKLFDLFNSKKFIENYFCNNGCNYQAIKILKRKPKEETKIINGKYLRKIYMCSKCGHYINESFISNIKNFYEGDYVKDTYGDLKTINNSFKRITRLKKNQSDNMNRVIRVISTVRNLIKKNNKLSLLDIGAGLGVFLYEIKKRKNWICEGLDPDKLQSKHISKFLKIKTHNFTLEKFRTKKKYNLITLNKVLEHQIDPLAFLKRAIFFLEKKGVIYIEVPDGEIAHKKGSLVNNEEFFIEHHHIFSFQSIQLLIKKTNLEIIKIERIKEPSGKNTIYIFCAKID